MKKLTFLLIILVFPFAGICQENTDLEKEEAAIKAVIEKETNAWINLNYESWKDCYAQDEPFGRLNTSPDSWGGANNWENYNSSMKTFFQNYEGPRPQPIKNENENYLIRVNDDDAWAVFVENGFDNEGNKTGWNISTRFLEKKDGKWKISYLGTHDVGSYEQGGEKLQTARNLCYNNVLAAINFAKSQGVTAEEYSKYETQLALPWWNKEMGLEEFANGIVSMETAMVNQVEILKQDEKKVIIKLSNIYPAFKSQGELFDVSYEEFITWMETMYSILSDHVGCNYSQVMNDEGVVMTIEKK